MSKTDYSYAVLSYSRDPASGERLNVGVVLVAPAIPFADVRWDSRAVRLLDCFADFSLPLFRDVRREFLGAVKQWHPYGQHRLFYNVSDAEALVRSLWPDGGLSYHVGVTGEGVTENPHSTLDYLYERYVTSQQATARNDVRVSDVSVWKRFMRRVPALQQIRLSPVPFEVDVPGAPLRFDYAAKNGRWHLFQPLSFELSGPEAIRDKAARWAGYGQMLAGNKEIAQLIFLLGAPTADETAEAFDEARSFLSSVSVRHAILADTDGEAAQIVLQGIVAESRSHF